MSNTIKDLSYKLERLDKDQKQGVGRKTGGARRGAGNNDASGIDSEKFKQVSKESSKVAIEMNHGMLVEALKEFMFTPNE